MANYQSTTEGSWIELLKVELKDEQETLLMSTDEADVDAQKELREQIKAKKEGEVQETKATKLTTFYQGIKPELKEEDTYQLISADVSEKQEGAFTGILNCRVNGEHKQIRF